MAAALSMRSQGAACPERGLKAILKKPKHNGETMSTYTFRITGMTCDHCARRAEDALNAPPGVWAEVSYEEAPADVGVEHLIERIESKGFEARLSE